MIQEINNHLYSIDNLIDEDYFIEISNLVSKYYYQPTGKDDPSSVWHYNGDFDPLISQNIIWTPNSDYQKILTGIPTLNVYPTNTILDQLLSKIHELAVEAGIYGELGVDWLGTLSSIYKYDSGKRLIWHTDSHNYTGAFTYYLHPEWKADWGGYFLYKNLPIPDLPSSDDGGFLFPSPNRLVFLKSPIPHSVSAISSPKGKPRIALTGFFVKPQKVQQLLERFTAYHS